MTGRRKRLYVSIAACLFCIAAGVSGCETMTGYTGSGGSVNASEMERRIVDLENKVSDLTREVAEINERTARNEKALDAYSSGTARKPVEEEAIGGEPQPTGVAKAPSAPDVTPPIDTAAPVTTAKAPGDTATAPEKDKTDSKVAGTPTDTAAAPTGDADTKKAQALYDRALSEIMNRKAESALPLFVAFVKEFPNDELTDNASYWIGECYYIMSDYQKALDQFRSVTEQFPDKDKTPDALLKMGYCYEKIGDAPKAKEVYTALIKSFPDSSAADLARGKIK